MKKRSFQAPPRPRIEKRGTRWKLLKGKGEGASSSAFLLRGSFFSSFFPQGDPRSDRPPLPEPRPAPATAASPPARPRRSPTAEPAGNRPRNCHSLHPHRPQPLCRGPPGAPLRLTRRAMAPLPPPPRLDSSVMAAPACHRPARQAAGPGPAVPAP